MSNMNNRENVQRQYVDDKNLSTRMRLHAKHSTNKQGFVPWLFEQYQFSDNDRILELGCGNGGQWEGRVESLPHGCSLVLSDYSEGMLRIVQDKYSQYSCVSFRQVDIQAIEFPDESFDVVIANHMLYHVPELSSALSEVKRVLKTGGAFYATTNGNGGMRPFLRDALKRFNPETQAFSQDFSFNLQNGQGILSAFFSAVQRVDYQDSLSITETQDLIDWIRSTISIASYTEEDLDGLFDYFEDIRKRDGAIHIPKEGGLFISIK